MELLEPSVRGSKKPVRLKERIGTTCYNSNTRHIPPVKFALRLA